MNAQVWPLDRCIHTTCLNMCDLKTDSRVFNAAVLQVDMCLLFVIFVASSSNIHSIQLRKLSTDSCSIRPAGNQTHIIVHVAYHVSTTLAAYETVMTGARDRSRKSEYQCSNSLPPAVRVCVSRTVQRRTVGPSCMTFAFCSVRCTDSADLLR